MNLRSRKLLVVYRYVLLASVAIGAFFLFEYLFNLFLSVLYVFLLTKASSEALAIFGIFTILLTACVACYGIHKICSIFTEKVATSYQSFKNENVSDEVFSEVYNDPTIELKDKILFFSIYLIYCIQLPYLYCASKASELSKMLSNSGAIGTRMCLVLINSILLTPVVLLELVKYPLVKLFSPLDLNVKQLNFWFNVSDLNASGQSIYTSSFEYSILQCARELKQKFGIQPNILNKEFEDYINGSNELTRSQKEQLRLYLNFNNNSNRSTWRELRTGLTLTQAVNLVLAAAKDQKLDVDLLKCILLVRLQEGNGTCTLGMFNRIIYSLSCFEAKNNFAVEVNSQVYGRIPGFVEKFLRHCGNKKMKILRDNFDSFYYGDDDIDPRIKDSIEKLIGEAKQFVFNELYIDYYDKYSKEIRRGHVKQKLRELITDSDIKEGIGAVVDRIEISIEKKPSTFLERVKAFFISVEPSVV